MAQNSPRSTIIAGNWKMYKTIQEAVGFVETLTPLIKKSQAGVYLAVPFTAIHPTSQRVKELKSPIKIGAQNMSDATEGAFTGEVAAKMLTDAGAEFVIVGHSERRHLFNESDAFVNRKIKRALASNLQSIVCIGETLEQRESGKMEEVVKNQLLQTLKGLSKEDFSKIILAYEPVWAIGTGKVAEASDAQSAHRFCRSVIAEKWGEEVALNLVIQYGGSVKPDNAFALLDQEDIDGLLVGGASLLPHIFSQIINAYQGSATA
jgi:triosephosphate isomerase (TIM)